MVGRTEAQRQRSAWCSYKPVITTDGRDTAEAGRAKKGTLPWTPRRHYSPADSLMGTCGLQNMRERVSVVLWYPGCGHSLQQPQEVNARPSAISVSIFHFPLRLEHKPSGRQESGSYLSLGFPQYSALMWRRSWYISCNKSINVELIISFRLKSLHNKLKSYDKRRISKNGRNEWSSAVYLLLSFQPCDGPLSHELQILTQSFGWIQKQFASFRRLPFRGVLTVWHSTHRRKSDSIVHGNRLTAAFCDSTRGGRCDPGLRFTTFLPWQFT